MSGGVFICYRREDSAGFARLIYDRLTTKLGRDNVFFDVDNTPVGVDFVDILSERVGKCDALIAVIGKTWVSSADIHSRRRLDDPNDFVRIEIEAALDRNTRVIPVLVDGAAMPRPEDLPDSLKKLARRHGIEISHTRFDSDVERLTRALSLLEEELRQREAAERAAREERGRREAAEAAEKAEQARRLAEAEAARWAEEERRAKEAAEAQRAREQRERREAAEAAEKVDRDQGSGEEALKREAETKTGDTVGQSRKATPEPAPSMAFASPKTARNLGIIATVAGAVVAAVIMWRAGVARALLDIIMIVLNLYTWVVIGGAILSWLIAFGVVNIRNDLVRAPWNLFFALTEPFLKPIRNFLPNMGGIDISPIILLLAVMFVQRIIIYYIYPYAF